MVADEPSPSVGDRYMGRHFEVSKDQVSENLEYYVDLLYDDIESSFLVLPKGPFFIEYARFVDAYETLKRETSGFQCLVPESTGKALVADGLVFVVLRTILGMSPPEWAEITSRMSDVEVSQGYARSMDKRARTDPGYFAAQLGRPRSITWRRVDAMLRVAYQLLSGMIADSGPGRVHRLAKVDTGEGLSSVQTSAVLGIPYAMLLYERFLGRPFASHRDSVSELVGKPMEVSVEAKLDAHGISYRKTGRAEQVPGFDQAPDFIIPDEFAPRVVIEAKIANDDGTARDKCTRIIHLAEMSVEREAAGNDGFQVVACVDGRGFAIRREDMRRLLTKLNGKVFTLRTIDELVANTGLARFVSKRYEAR